MIYKKTKKDIKEAALSKAIRKDKSSKENRRPIHFSDSESKVKNKFRFQEECTYVPDFMHNALEEADSVQTIDDISDVFYFFPEMLFQKLRNELKMQISGNLENDEKIITMINVLDNAEGCFSGDELFAIDFCMSTYASCCVSGDRIHEICRNIYLLSEELEGNNIDPESLSRKIRTFDIDELFELTEIILNSEVIGGCVWKF